VPTEFDVLEDVYLGSPEGGRMKDHNPFTAEESVMTYFCISF